MRHWFVLAGLPLAACMPSADQISVGDFLVSHRVYYDQAPDGQAEPPLARRDSQEWSADGRTVYHGWGLLGSDKAGMWKLENGAYCSVFPTPDVTPVWECYRIDLSADGTRIEFVPVHKKLFERDWKGTAVPRK